MLLDVGLELKSDLNRWVEGVREKRDSSRKGRKERKGVVEGKGKGEGIPRRPKGGVAEGDALAGVGCGKKRSGRMER